jgi:uncharacterized membrane protein
MDSHATPYTYSPLAKGLLGGLFVGIAATVLNLLFDLVYRKMTGYEFAQYVNINSIIFFTIPTLIAAGIAYSVLVEYVKKGAMIYVIGCIVITVIFAFVPLGPSMLPTNQPMPTSARGLTLGIEIITGVLAAFALPYFAEHEKIWG